MICLALLLAVKMRLCCKMNIQLTATNNSLIAFSNLQTGFKKIIFRSSQRIYAFRNEFLENIINYFGNYLKINHSEHACFVVEC